MKNLSAKLKGLNYQELLVDHGEKFVFGFIGVVCVLAMLSTNWSSFSEFTPEELTRRVSGASAQLESREWPKEETEKFSETNTIDKRSKFLLSAVDVRPYQYTTPTTWQLYPPVKKVQEPTWLRVERLIASAGRVIVGLKASADSVEGDVLAKADTEKKEKTPKSRQFKARRPVGAVGAGAAGGPLSAPGASNPDGGVDELQQRLAELGKGNPKGRGGQPSSPEGAPGAPPGGLYAGGPGIGSEGSPGMSPDGMAGMEGMGMPMGNMSMTEQMSRGERYVSVRGIFPMDMQARRIFSATNAAYDKNAVRAIVQIYDFELERKEKRIRDPGDAWTDWKAVNLEMTKDLLNQLANFDSPVVHSGVRHRVITQPLPGRVFGFWEDDAWHPDIANYRLTEEQQRLADLTNEALAKHAQQNNQVLKQMQSKTLGGFAAMQLDTSELARGVGGTEAGARSMQQFSNAEAMAGQLQMTTSAAAQAISDMQGKDADGYILLYRYFDFNVEPGKMYCYRVRLKIKNPNENRKLEEVDDPSIIAGDFRFTKWSEPTDPAAVAEEVDYFLANVDPPRNVSFPMECDFNIFQWYQETGTTINQTLQLKLGNFISGKPETTKVLRPGIPSLEDEEDIEFETEDFVVDLASSIALDYSDRDFMELHKDLGLPSKMKGKFGDAVEGLVVNRFGELVEVDPLSRADVESMKKRKLDEERADFRSIEDQIKNAAEAAGTGDALADRIENYGAEGGKGDDGQGEAGGTRRSSRRGRRGNALRLQGGGSGAGGYPGGGGAGAYPGAPGGTGGYPGAPGASSPPGGPRRGR